MKLPPFVVVASLSVATLIFRVAIASPEANSLVACPLPSTLEASAPARADRLPSEADKTLEGRAVFLANAAYWNYWACTQEQRQGRDMNLLDDIGSRQVQWFLTQPETAEWVKQVVLVRGDEPRGYTLDQIRKDPELIALLGEQYRRGGITSQGWVFPFVEPAMP